MLGKFQGILFLKSSFDSNLLFIIILTLLWLNVEYYFLNIHPYF